MREVFSSVPRCGIGWLPRPQHLGRKGERCDHPFHHLRAFSYHVATPVNTHNCHAAGFHQERNACLSHSANSVSVLTRSDRRQSLGELPRDGVLVLRVALRGGKGAFQRGNQLDNLGSFEDTVAGGAGRSEHQDPGF